MKYILCIFAIATVAMPVAGQQKGSFSEHTPNSVRKLIVTPSASPSSVHDLVRMSHVIVQGTVTSNSSTRSYDRGRAFSPTLITETAIAVDRVLKGQVRGKSGCVLLSQIGGETEGGVSEAVNDKLIAEGESYIFFLINDEGQADRPNESALARYSVTGVWSGKARITGAGIEFLPGATPGLRKFNGMSLDDFVAEIKKAQNPPPSTEKLPIHPGGGRRQ